MKNTVSFLLIFIASLFLTACGSSNSSGIAISPKIISLNGAVVDGYISAASVCLDLNGNGSCDVNEPTTLTSTSGAFSFSTIDVTDIGFVTLVASGGKDTATNKSFLGKFRNTIDTNTVSQTEKLFITPLTDLITISFLGSLSKTSQDLQNSTTQIATAYTISETYVNKSPMQYAGVFARTQEIQQTVALMEVAASKAKGVSLTSLELLQLRSDIKNAIVKQISEDLTLNIANTLTKLETSTKLTIPENEKSFIIAQIAEIKVAIDKFVQHKDLTPTYINKFQLALEEEEDKAFAALENAASGANIPPMVLSIDVFTETNTTVPDNNTTDPNTSEPYDPTTTITFGGVMADGYISDATACLDINNDGVCSLSEVSAKTLVDGTFIFSNITVQKNAIIPIIGFGGTDTATNKLFHGEFQNMLDVNTTSLNTEFNLTPFTDLIQVLYSTSTLKNKIALDKATQSFADALGLSISDTVKDPMLDIGIFSKSQIVQHIKSLLEFIANRAITNVLTASQKRDLQNKIKKVLLTQLLDGGYGALNMSRIVSSLEIDLNVAFSDNDKNFVILQLAEIKRIFNTLSVDPDIHIWTLPRLQLIVETVMEQIYAKAEYMDMNITTAIVIHSIQSKTNALYDKNACVKDAYYKNTVDDSNITSIGKVDAVNGVTIKSEYDQVTLYYPDLGLTKSGDNIVVFEDNYYFSFDKAWINADKQIYIRTPKDSTGLYGCYSVKLNTDIPSEIKLVKVYRYVDSDI